MPDPKISERDIALGGAMMRDIERRERREGENSEHSKVSTSSAAMSIVFVAATSIGMLVVMILFAN